MDTMGKRSPIQSLASSEEARKPASSTTQCQCRTHLLCTTQIYVNPQTEKEVWLQGRSDRDGGSGGGGGREVRGWNKTPISDSFHVL